MHIEAFREHCMAVKGATESTPFIDPDVVVFKVMDKMFAMLALTPKDGIHKADLKCDPDYTLELRERYEGIGPSHIKTTLLWNRIVLASDVPDALIRSLINHAVEEVVKKLPKKKQAEYANIPG